MIYQLIAENMNTRPLFESKKCFKETAITECTGNFDWNLV